MFPLTLDLLRSRRAMLLGICAALLLTSIGYLALYPSFDEQLQGLAEDLPDAYKAFIGDVDIATPEGYIRSQVYSLLAPLLIAGATIAAGSGLARAERDKSLAVLTMTPVSRSKIAASWLLFIVIVAGVGGLMAFIGVLIGGPIAGAEVGVARVLLATAPLIVFGALIGSATLLTSALSGAPSMATGVGWMTILLSFLANSLANLIDNLGWLSNISPWSWHGAGEAITTDFGLTGFLLLIIATAGAGVGAVIAFSRRNLHL